MPRATGPSGRHPTNWLRPGVCTTQARAAAEAPAAPRTIGSPPESTASASGTDAHMARPSITPSTIVSMRPSITIMSAGACRRGVYLSVALAWRDLNCHRADLLRAHGDLCEWSGLCGYGVVLGV